jgi:hypothetical protein
MTDPKQWHIQREAVKVWWSKYGSFAMGTRHTQLWAIVKDLCEYLELLKDCIMTLLQNT